MEPEGSGGSEGSAGLLQQILSLKLVPRVGNGTLCPNATSLCSFPATARRHSVDSGTCGVLPVQYLRGQVCEMAGNGADADVSLKSRPKGPEFTLTAIIWHSGDTAPKMKCPC
ncbi:hypothetical protein QTO34_010625, partial [Cnephaeus nilssonii]